MNGLDGNRVPTMSKLPHAEQARRFRISDLSSADILGRSRGENRPIPSDVGADVCDLLETKSARS
jgi:hypothetical protein